MRDDEENQKNPNDSPESPGVSRREFLEISGISVAVPLVAGPRVVKAAGQEVRVYGPGKVPMEFAINGKNYKATLARGNQSGAEEANCFSKNDACSTPLGQRLRVAARPATGGTIDRKRAGKTNAV